MQALTIDEINWLMIVIKNQTDLAPGNERKLKIKVLAHLVQKKWNWTVRAPITTGNSRHQFAHGIDKTSTMPKRNCS